MTAPANLPQRQDGWTPARRAAFLAAVAEGHTVEAACGVVGLSPASAYALRRRQAGEAFALGWRAAALLARERLADLLASRAIDGQVDTFTRADGESVTRHRYDNRLAMALLTRLDRLAERPAPAPSVTPAPAAVGAPAWAREPAPWAVPPAPPSAAAPAATDEGAAARAAAGDFARFLALVEEGGEAGRVAAFLASGNPQLPQLRLPKGREWLADEPELAAEIADEPWWYDEEDEQYLTRFVPPPDFSGREYGRYGDPHYARTLMPDEAAAWVDHLPTPMEDED